MEKGKMLYLIVFFINIALIAFLQHRTVWIATGVALVINFLLFKKASYKINGQLYAPLVFIPAIACFLLFSIILSGNPEIVEKLKDRADDIVNYKTEGTGSWRYEQFQSYLPYIKENIFTGMRFEGFELPIQFYHPEAGTPNFNDGTGHHFHSYYVDKLFYFGLLGLIVLFSPLLYIAYLAFNRRSFNALQITMISFCLSGMFYGISYNWPAFFIGFIGVGIAIIEKKDTTDGGDDKSESEIFEERVKSLKNEFA